MALAFSDVQVVALDRYLHIYPHIGYQMTFNAYQYHTEPMAHQRLAFDVSRDKPTYAFFMEPGTGKSKVAIDTGAYLYEQGRIDAMLVVADNGVHENWVDVEVPRHMPPRVKARPVAYRSGKSLKRFFAALGDACRDFPVLCVSYDTLTTKVGQKFLTDFTKQRRVLMVLDESQRIKTPSAKRTRAAWAFGKLALYRRILHFIEEVYNRKRLHSSLGYLSPDTFEEQQRSDTRVDGGPPQ